MGSDIWVENYYSKLESRKNQISPGDFRFYNITRLPLLAQQTSFFSKDCSICSSNLKELENLLENLPECLHKPETRKNFEQKKIIIEKHLQKAHNVKFATYYTSFFTLIFSLAGAITGWIISLIFLDEISVNLILILSAVGLISGQVAGNKTDRRKYNDKLQI
ncbi:MAG: hypothetical protein JW894_06620 [Bacteroidales bacterium]|nr:hypothetical protein [Bacteroidales bacterium]